MSDHSNSSQHESWHLSRTINVSHLIATAAAIISVMWWISGYETRMSQVELNIAHIQQGRATYEARTEKKFDELKGDLRLINDKLDRLIRERD